MGETPIPAKWRGDYNALMFGSFLALASGAHFAYSASPVAGHAPGDGHPGV